MRLHFVASALLCAALLSGCETLSQALENDVACSPNWQNAYFLSMYGPLGVGAKVKAESAVRICESLVLRQMLVEQQLQRQQQRPAGFKPEEL